MTQFPSEMIFSMRIFEKFRRAHIFPQIIEAKIQAVFGTVMNIIGLSSQRSDQANVIDISNRVTSFRATSEECLSALSTTA